MFANDTFHLTGIYQAKFLQGLAKQSPKMKYLQLINVLEKI